MKEIDLGDDTGFVQLKISDVEQELDVYQVYNRLCEISNATVGEEKQLNECYGRVVDLIQELGYPPVSHHLAVKFFKAMSERVAELKNGPGAGPKPGSAASTGQAPSPCPAPTSERGNETQAAVTRHAFCHIEFRSPVGEEQVARVMFADAAFELPLATLSAALDRLHEQAGGDDAAFLRAVVDWLKPYGVTCGEDSARLFVEAARDPLLDLFSKLGELPTVEVPEFTPVQ